MIYELEDTSRVEALFEGWEETLIYSCLQKVMESLHTGYNSQNDKEKRVNFQFDGDEVIVSCIGSKTYGEAYEYFR